MGGCLAAGEVWAGSCVRQSRLRPAPGGGGGASGSNGAGSEVEAAGWQWEELMVRLVEPHAPWRPAPGERGWGVVLETSPWVRQHV